MYYDLDKMPIKVLKEGKAIDFIYDNKEYFFKEAPYEEMLKELVAEKIARRFKIPCCHYAPAIYKGVKGVISESAFGILDVGYTTMGDYFLKNNCINSQLFDYSRYNNLENIWNDFYYDLDIPSSIVKKLMNEVTDIFLFDALIGNKDRHSENYGIIIDGQNTHMAPLFDNNEMLSKLSLNNGGYWLGIEEKETPLTNPSNLLYKFLDISDRIYHKRLKDGLKIISEESLIEIFQELKAEGVILDTSVVAEILEKFAQNREMINNYFNSKRKSY